MSKTKQRKPAGRRYARVQTRDSWMHDLPLLPIVVGAVLVAGAIALIIFTTLNGNKTSSADPVRARIPCVTSEQLAVHYHAHLSILVNGNATVLPAGVGIDQATQCLYWIHTHTADGVIHIEAPKSAAARKFTLGDFFTVWQQPLDSTHIGATTLTADEKLVMFVNGKAYTGDPRKIVLGPHTLVVLEVTPPEVTTPPGFSFPSGE